MEENQETCYTRWVKFVDELVLDVESGKGGGGMVSFRREKYVPFGGPSGGDGGKGGDVVLQASRDFNTLFELGFRRLYKGEDGEKGMAKDMIGASGKDYILKVPVGTLVFNQETAELLCDLAQDDARFIVARGGRGGRGNARFANSVRRAPRIAEKGEPGERLRLRLELKLLADVGLVGQPNAGKSTLLASVSNARPKIADYPFTTLAPSLGIVKREDFPAFCMADLPGIIEGAHAGTGLGTHFLKHIERTRLLLHLVDLGTVELSEARKAFTVILQEMREYDPAMLDKPMIVVATKMDLPSARENWPAFRTWIKRKGYTAVAISAASHDGLPKLLAKVTETLSGMKPVEVRGSTQEKLFEFLPSFGLKYLGPGKWQVSGREIERLVAMTDFGSDESIQLFKKKIQKFGFIEELSRAEAGKEDLVSIGEMEFEVGEFDL